MATTKSVYDSPNNQVRRESTVETTAGATTEFGKFRVFQAMRLKAVHTTVVTAGTIDAHGFDIYVGTTSVASVVVGTAAAGGVASSATLNEAVAANETMSVKSLADATGVDGIVFEYETDKEALKTV
jgi:hypothetical protein